MVTNKKYKWLKWFVAVALIILLAGGFAIWYIFTEKFTNTSELTADYHLKAADLIHGFEKSDSLANKKYAEKIITVTGMVSEIEAADTTVNLKMSDSISGSYIIFSFQKENQSEARLVKAGQALTIKGSCSGGAYSSILETEYISFKRCVINK